MDPRSNNELEQLRRDVSPDVLTPRIVDFMFRNRHAGSSYVSTGGARLVTPDVMLEFEWQGRRYVVPAWEKK